ncbi:hypothetical protein M422DRAFT_262883 [Sphaerobolus stellatus SS14]|uniref:Glutathione transferase n=1 Tax=Sphaerobolus stellatus (strain SS14) TaxID=990650 RepID=A0A0C9VBS1_SPHS4|nr:hypothetical protein M422DRAFT_262883 [Sphaerobolus stellatus SS14]
MAPQITFFFHSIMPNPTKDALILEALGLDWVAVDKDASTAEDGMKHENYLKINPMGQVPAIIDHTNDDKVLWDSGAILLYLGEKFDSEGKFVGKTLDERAEVWQWLLFQASGLSVMQQQFMQFSFFHPVKNLDPSVYAHFKNEIYRTYDVLERHLQNHDFLALDRYTVADMGIYPWLAIGTTMAGNDVSKHPKLAAYIARIKEIPSVAKAYEKLGAVASEAEAARKK